MGLREVEKYMLPGSKQEKHKDQKAASVLHKLYLQVASMYSSDVA